MTGNAEDEKIIHRLNKANEVINQFITSCSHSMRGPLKSIEGLVNIMRNIDSHNGVDPAMMLNLIEKSVEKMESMLDELEHFMINSEKEIEIQMVDIKTVIERTVNNFIPVLSEEGIDVSIQVEQKRPFYSDASRIRLLLNHLIDNAITFQKEGKGNKKIQINAKVTPLDCTVFIEDNGIGIQEGEHENIFKMFHRASNQSKGAGIGLYLVKEALDKIGGSILVDSQLDVGSKFVVGLKNFKKTYREK